MQRIKSFLRHLPWTLLILASVIVYQGIAIRQQAHEYALLIAENQLAVGRLIEQHHHLESQAILETCTPRVF